MVCHRKAMIKLAHVTDAIDDDSRVRRILMIDTAFLAIAVKLNLRQCTE